ncbi:MAG: NUDIX domain-containing protein [Proteobacteria bacterium]|nr:NUDIX domain-containing protein [Pseudomonadota bacterium]
MASKTIEAAGGIVVRKGGRALIAVVQRAKDDAWVLPRGKLKRDENPMAGAKREVVEETGHRVTVHEYVGAITYRAGGRPKVVQFWRMEADKDPSHELMRDIVAVEWLPLKAAIRRLSYPLEKLFLRHAAARAVAHHKRRTAERKAGRGAKHRAVGKPVPKKSGALAKLSKTPKLKPLKNDKKSGKNKSSKSKSPKRKAAKGKGSGKRGGKGRSKGKGKAAGKAKSRQATARHRAPLKKASHRKASAKTSAKRSAKTTSSTMPPHHETPPEVRHVAGDSAPVQSLATSVPERAPAPSAESKSILQRVLGRLAG